MTTRPLRRLDREQRRLRPTDGQHPAVPGGNSEEEKGNKIDKIKSNEEVENVYFIVEIGTFSEREK